jgi:hypothetical protein
MKQDHPNFGVKRSVVWSKQQVWRRKSLKSLRVGKGKAPKRKKGLSLEGLVGVCQGEESAKEWDGDQQGVLI